MNLSTKVLLGAGLVSLIGWVLTGAYDALPVFLNVMQEINQLARLGVNSNTTNFTLIAAGMGLFYYLSPLSVAWMMRGAYKGKATTRTKRGAAIIPRSWLLVFPGLRLLRCKAVSPRILVGSETLITLSGIWSILPIRAFC